MVKYIYTELTLSYQNQLFLLSFLEKQFSPETADIFLNFSKMYYNLIDGECVFSGAGFITLASLQTNKISFSWFTHFTDYWHWQNA